MEILVKKISKYANNIKKFGDWIDLPFCGVLKHTFYIAEQDAFNIREKNGKVYYHFLEGDTCILSLGVAIKLPPGYEAILAPRSSLFFKHKIIMGCSIGIIDNNYCGDDDIWCFPAYFIKNTKLFLGQRIAQFRIVKNMETVEIKIVDKLNCKNRGGIGSTGD